MATLTAVEAIFQAALEKGSAQQRAAYLDEACQGDSDLRQQVERLLHAQQQLGNFLEKPAAEGTTIDDVSPGDGINTADLPTPSEESIGPYKLLQQIGQGGFGVVFMAEQTQPLRRKVALKVLKPGMDTRQVVARFEAERQALALMDHPNIARVFDGGETTAGRPYFVMELVRGTRITEFCDHNQLNVRQRLELFVSVCGAVQHAHQKGIIHRDIKPSNVLVMVLDAMPVVKVIDFGVAKALGQELTDKTLITGFAQMIGTPLYMSPEQAGQSELDVDTRSDIYSLGALLYELLAGTTPFAKDRLREVGYDEMRRIIREEEPPKPSARLSTLGQSAATVSANRKSDPKKLGQVMRGELDWIVMKALEKDRTRRYETANGFAADVLRYLGGEAVLAHPPSTAYRLKKFVKRYKGQMLAASVVFFALVAGIVGTTLGLLESKRQEGLALGAAEEERQAKLREAERAEGEKLAKLEAQKNLQQANENLAFATKGNDILGSVFTGLDPRKNYATLGELSQALNDNLQRAVQQLEGSAIGDPLTVAQMQNTLGLSLLGLGKPSQALILLEKARTMRAAKLGPDHPDTLQSMHNLAMGYREAGKLDLAQPLMQETLKLRRHKLGPDHPDTLQTMNNLALGYLDAGKPGLALPLLQETLKLRRAKLGPDHPDTLHSMSNLALGYKDVGRKLDLALPLWEETLKLMRDKLGPDHPDTLTSMNNLAMGYKEAGKLDLALPLLQETFKLMRDKLGSDHPATLNSMNSLAEGYHAARKLDLALPLLQETLKLRRTKLGPDHPNTLQSMNNLAEGYRSVGKLDSALPLIEETFKLMKTKLGPDHPNTLSSMNNLAVCYRAARRLDKSVPLLEETLKLRERKNGRQHPDTQLTLANLGVHYKDAGRVQEALPLLEEAFQTGKTNPTLRRIGPQLLDAYEKAGKSAEAAKLVTELLADARKQLPKDSPQLAAMLAQFGASLLQAHAFGNAEALLRECLAIREKTQADAWNTFYTMSMLGGALLGQKKHAEAEPLLLKGYEGVKQREKTIPKGGEDRIAEALDRLIECYTATNKPDEAKKWRAERANYPQAKKPFAAEKK